MTRFGPKIGLFHGEEVSLYEGESENTARPGITRVGRGGCGRNGRGVAEHPKVYEDKGDVEPEVVSVGTVIRTRQGARAAIELE